ncbi:MAG: FitA-like ribbon-helix-helix domain-containing protein [Pyrinomonadaceae bacterium]
MATLTIRNVPSELYDALTKQAKRRHRSLNSEAIFQLESVLAKREMDVETELDEIRRFREKLKDVYVTEEEINREKNRGRL